ncbi:MAG TPA: FlgO family outer membrane protein [Gemmatimonadaceae bacterium]|jgi:hypothetical protein|nr:FlgO family outer membrane protein [Gemmatimonadaceae bacterium]
MAPAALAALFAAASCGRSAPSGHAMSLRIAPDTAAADLSFDEAIERLAGRFASHGGRVAVLDFPDLARRQTQLGQLISQSLTTSLVTTPHDSRLRVLERLQVDQVMKELNFASANLTEDDLEHIGRALNADALVFGTAASAGGGMAIVNARMVEVAGRTIIDAGRVTARIPSGISMAALPEPAIAMTSMPSSGAGVDQMGDVRPASRRQGSSISDPGTTWVFELQQCGSAGGTRVTCDLTVTNSGPVPAPLALFFDHGQFGAGSTRVVDDREIAYAPSLMRFSPNGAGFAYGSYPAPAVAIRNDVRRYPSMTPVHFSLEIEGVAVTVSTLRSVEIVGGPDMLSLHDVMATFRDVPIRR